MKSESERLVKGITLCPKCYEVGKRSPLIFNSVTKIIFCQERKHEWIPEEWLAVHT